MLEARNHDHDKALLVPEEVCPGKSLLAEIVSMLITMRKTAADRVCEDRALYRIVKGGNP